MIDTHAHIYTEEFDSDRDAVVERAKAAGVQTIILPNIDSQSLDNMIQLESMHPDYFHAAIGVHPESIQKDYQRELAVVKTELERRKYIAVGEIGIDLHWDKTFYREQVMAFQTQVEWALNYQLPLIIHVRDSHKETLEALQPFHSKPLKGVFHCFGGSIAEAEEIFAIGDFVLGIGGVVTFKNSRLPETLKAIPLERIVLETDSPYLAPVPFRGKRNEPANIALIRDEIAKIYNISPEEVDQITTATAKRIFSL